ncbi:MAG: AAA family ATPase [Candidatus Nezhaarchaeota archaeon]|nr:AAA family ATPase [Candidatus Nezhaarchaeota archaeon]
MRLRVENFGPISYADVEVKPLTVIIGKNNSGKSMIAQLMFTLMSLKEGYLGQAFLSLISKQIRMRYPIGISALPLTLSLILDKDFEERIKKAETPYSIVKTFIEAVVHGLAKPLDKVLRDLLERHFAVELRRLVNLCSDCAKVECAYSRYSTIEFTVTKDGNLEARLNIKVEELIDSLLKDEEVGWLISKYLTKKRRPAYPLIVDKVVARMIELMFPRKPLLLASYIPAGRAGLLEGYEVVSSALIRLAPSAPLRGISMPPMPGMASEFYYTMLQLEGRDGPFAKMADLFKELIGGDIVFEKLKAPEGKSKMVYTFKFNDREGSVDLIHAASMVKELAPIYLVVKELADKGFLLIVEEPESHLHPGAQVKLMEIFVKLVNEGLNIVMTTHSDILLRKLAHLILSGSIGTWARLSLNPKDVCIYLLKPGEGGYVTQEVNVCEEVPTFDEVIKQLYEEERELYLALQEESQ